MRVTRVDANNALTTSNNNSDIQRFSKDDLASIRKSAQDFESLFTGIMLKSMRDSINKSGFIDGGNGEEIFRSMLDAEHATQMAKTGSFGIAADLERQLLGDFANASESLTKLKGEDVYMNQSLPLRK